MTRLAAVVLLLLLAARCAHGQPWHFVLFYTSLLPPGFDALSKNATQIGSFAIPDVEIEQAIALWQEYVAANQPFDVGGQQVTFEMVVLRDNFNTSAMISNFYAGVYGLRADVYIPPFNPARLAPVLFAGIVPTAFPSLGTFNTPVFQSAARSLFSVFQSTGSLLDSPLLQLRINGGSTAAVVYVDDPVYSESCGPHASGPLGDDNGIQIVGSFAVDASNLSASRAAVEQVVRDIVALDPDLVHLCSGDDLKALFMQLLRERDWLPKMLTMIPATYNNEAPDYLRDMYYVTEGGFWSPTSRFTDPVWGTVANFTQAWIDRFGYSPNDGLPAAVLASLAAYQQAVADYIDAVTRQGLPLVKPQPSDMLFYISRATLDSCLLGTVRFDARNSNSGQPFVLDQRFPPRFLPPDSKALAVFPPKAAVAAAVYPMPTWSERVYEPSFCSQTSEIVVGVFIGVCSATSIGWMVFVVACRRVEAVRVASVVFLLTMLVGSLLMYNAVWGWMLYVTDASCIVMTWLGFVGYGLFFCSLIVKNFRILRIFTASQNMKNYALSLPAVLASAVAILLPIVVLLIVWTAVDPLQAVRIVNDPYRPAKDTTVCNASDTSDVFIGLLVGYCGLLLLALIVLGAKTWKIDRAVLNESVHLALATYVFAVAMIVALIIVATGAVDPEIEFIIRSFCLLAGVWAAVTIIMVPKVIYAVKGKTARTVSGLNSASLVSISASSHSLKT